MRSKDGTGISVSGVVMTAGPISTNPARAVLPARSGVWEEAGALRLVVRSITWSPGTRASKSRDYGGPGDV